MKILAVNSKSFSRDALAEAVEASAEQGSIELLIEYYSKVSSVTLDYRNGASYPTLTRSEGTMDMLSEIMEPR